mgnify:CR=1 FL=1
MTTPSAHAESPLTGLTADQVSDFLEGCPDAVLIVDRVGTVVRANRRAAETLGRLDQGAARQSIFDLLPAREAERRRIWLSQTVRTKAGYTGLGRLGRRQFSIRLTPILGAGGDVAFVAIHAAEVTPETDLRHELQRTQDQLVRAQKLETAGRFAAAVAHDLNNLLVAVNGLIELAQDPQDSAAEVQEDLEEAKKAALQASSLVRDLLGFARAGASSIQPVELSESLKGMAPLLRTLLGAKYSLEMLVHNEPISSMIDAGELQQVLTNLVVNARDAMPQGGVVKVALETGTHIDGAEKLATITVTDSGEGIPPEVAPLVFEPFFTTKDPGVGTGLGLATCRTIVRAAGGEISFTSGPGLGTTFTVELPRDDNVRP